jgi:L-aspartate oxidase
MRSFDFLVIGSGIAGLSFALEASKAGRVAVVSKKSLSLSSSSWAQGGIAAVSSKDDDFSLHIDDTLKAGAGLCKPEIVELIIKEAPESIAELEKFGTTFDKTSDGNFHLHKEGGHSRRRVLHAADSTGFEIQTALLNATKANQNIELFENCCAVDLITSWKMPRRTDSIGVNSNKVLGAYILLADGSVEPFIAGKVLLATGGAGKVYLYTSNPDVATGDGIAMAYRAGCRVANLEFYQFHPTCLYHPKAKTFLISEALRGEGALLRNSKGEEFMSKYDSRKELASRDIVARAIDHQMKVSGEECVYLDITHKSESFIMEHFPAISAKCLEFGIDISRQMIPVVPAAHYCCGGIVTDNFGRTDLENLYAAGETACTGLHGANRLASNSLLEGVVIGIRSAKHAIQSNSKEYLNYSAPDWNEGTATNSDEQVVVAQNWDEIRRFMWNYVGIVRSTKRLERAHHRNQIISKEIKDYYWNHKVTSDLLELRNLNLVAELVIQSALARKESRGLHFTLDYPDLNPKYEKDTVILPGQLW